MVIKVGINGFGRIGRTLLRAAQNRKDIDIVAINDLLNINYLYYLLKFDSTHGNFLGTIKIENNKLIINNKNVICISKKDPKEINWNNLNVDIVVESTGIFLEYKKSIDHIYSGAKKVVLTGPAKDGIPMFVMGVNHKKYSGEKIVSNASCTTNCLAPLLKVVHENFVVEEAFMTTIHSATANQKTVDGPSNKDWRGGRSVFNNIIPSSTGAAQAIGKIIPELNGKITGMSFRIPTINVSVIDLTVRLNKNTTFKNICNTIKYASQNELKGILGYTEDEVVSSDFNGNTLTSIFDAKSSILLNNKFIKLISWYDNETGYSNKVLDLISYISNFN